MSALADPKLEKFTQALLSNLARSKAAEKAAVTAGYTGSSLGHNARKRAGRNDVKARMAELAAPAQAETEREVVATVETAIAKLSEIGTAKLGDDAIKVPDQIAAWKLMAQIKGWLAPEKRDIAFEATVIRVPKVSATAQEWIDQYAPDSAKT